ncbi:unnamed protein product [Tilletia controversa]|nr:unnamed protein product [Tilletia controversa]
MPPGSQRKKQASKASTTCSLCTHSTSSCTCSEPSPAAPSSTRPQPRTRTRTRAGAAAAAAAPPGLSPAAAPGPAAAPAPDPVSAAAVAASGSAGSPAAAAPPSGPGPAAISGSASAHAGLQLATSSGPAAWPAAAAASPSPEPAASSGPAAAGPAPAGPAATPLHSAPATAAAEAVEAATAASTLTFSPHFMPGSVLASSSSSTANQHPSAPDLPPASRDETPDAPVQPEAGGGGGSLTNAGKKRKITTECSGDEGDEQEDEDDETDGKTTFSESKSRHLWLSTVDALNHVKGSPKWQFIDDDRKRARVVREKYWRLVKEAAILSNRTGIHIFLATGRSDRVTQGLKEHVFVSEELCNPANKCLHDTAHAMALSWSSGLAAYRETLIAQNKAKDELLRQHQAQFLANQRQLQEKEAALTAALADAAAMREELDQIRATNVAGSTSAGGPSLAPEST